MTYYIDDESKNQHINDLGYIDYQDSPETPSTENKNTAHERRNFLDWQYDWIEYCYYRSGCQLDYPGAKGCISAFCKTHGWNSRVKDCKWVWEHCEPTTESSRVVLNFDFMVPPKIVTQARKEFFKSLKKEFGKVGYVWRLHWMFKKPHLDMTISILLSDLKPKIKSAWTNALTYINHPSPSASRTYCEATKDWRGSIWYIFQCGEKQIPYWKCPPQVKGQRWTYWDASRK